MDDAVDVAALDNLAERPAEVDVIDPEQAHELAITMRAQLAVIRLPPFFERLDEIGTDELTRIRGDELRRLVRALRAQERREHAVDVELVGIAQELREEQCLLARRRADLLLVVAADGKAHERFVSRREFLHEIELRQDLEAEVGMVFRLGIVERLVEAVLAEAPDIVEEAHDLSKLGIVLRKLQVLRELHRD